MATKSAYLLFSPEGRLVALYFEKPVIIPENYEVVATTYGVSWNSLTGGTISYHFPLDPKRLATALEPYGWEVDKTCGVIKHRTQHFDDGEPLSAYFSPSGRTKYDQECLWRAIEFIEQFDDIVPDIYPVLFAGRSLDPSSVLDHPLPSQDEQQQSLSQ